MDADTARQRFDELRSQDGILDTDVLDEVFDALDPVDCDSILGEWTGGDFETGHFISKQSQEIRWYGKTFNSRLDVKPLICYDEDGELYANTELAGGDASLWMIEFRGKVSASMVSDGLPMIDHFRKVDENTLMGITDGKEIVLDNGKRSYFYLQRV